MVLFSTFLHHFLGQLDRINIQCLPSKQQRSNVNADSSIKAINTKDLEGKKK